MQSHLQEFSAKKKNQYFKYCLFFLYFQFKRIYKQQKLKINSKINESFFRFFFLYSLIYFPFFLIIKKTELQLNYRILVPKPEAPTQQHDK